MKDNYLDNPNTDEDRQERAQKKKKSKAGKGILTVLGFIVVAVVVFLVTIKLVQPDFKLTQLIPESVSQSIDEKLSGKTTEAPVTETTTVIETTTEPEIKLESAEYLPIEQFKLENGKKGNDMGNILEGGKVGTDQSYIYHIVDGRGIYRFEPYSESYARVYQTEHKLSSLNLKGDYIYFVDETDSVLYRMKKGSGKPEKLSNKARKAVVYDNRVYFETTHNSIKTINLEKLKAKELYATDNEIELIGISLKGVFFTEKSDNGMINYITVDTKKELGARIFRQPSEDGEIVSPVLENGYLYFFEKQNGAEYNLCRQKYGAKEAVTLIKNVTCFNHVIAHNNRLFYAELDGETFKMMELNMNSDSVKTMLTAKNVGVDNELTIQHGGEYDFIIGRKKPDGDKVYSASSMYTGSANIMRFKEGAWSYK